MHARTHAIDHRPSPRRMKALAVATCGLLAFGTLAACEDDDEVGPDETEVEVISSDVSVTSIVTEESEVTVGTVVTSEVTETSTFTSEVELTTPGVTSGD